MSSTIYLTDTNILSELARPRPHRGVIKWAESVTAVAVSVITVEEVFYGLAWKPNARVREWFEQFFERNPILPVTREVARAAGEMRGQLRREGLTRTQADLLIGATASVHQLTLVTRNVRDFAGCRIGLLNPFD